ncbi:MAG: alpha-galactosidase [Chloroflexi bacterium]|nr:alpha-galactosidase [Chloroflexota bacterium]
MLMLMRTPADNIIDLSNTLVSLRLTLRDGQISYQLTSTNAGLDISDGRLGELSVAGVPISWTSIHPQTVTRHHDGSSVAEVVVSAPGMVYNQYVQSYPDRPFVRFWGVLYNTSNAPITLTACAIAHLVIPQAPLYLFHVDQFSWPHRSDFFSQHQSQIWPGRTPLEIRMGSYPSHYDAATSCAWFALKPPPFDYDPEMPPSQGPGLVAGIEFNGKSRVFGWATPDATHVQSRIDSLNHVLKPDARFEVPAIFIGRYHGDWDESAFVTHRFAESYVHPPRPDDRYPWVQYNSWKYGQEINEAQQLEVIDRCHELGIEVVVMDLGWANMIGDWHPNKTKFPRGLKSLAERARSYGMRFGVHIAIAQCAPEAPIAKQHPEWLVSTYDDYFAAGFFCFGNDPCRNWIIEQVSRLIEQEGIDYIIQDGEDMVKYCTRADHTHAPGDSNYANSQYGIDVVIGTLREKYPHVVFENCEDGGMMMTYKMARLYHTSITVDNIATYATRQGTYGASYPFSPRYSVRYMEDDPTPYTLRSSIFGGPLILMQRITDWDNQQFTYAKAAIDEYKSYRTLIRDAKVIHVLPPRYNVQRKGWGWDAIQAVTPDQSESVLMVFRAMGDVDARAIKPRGLDATATYVVRIKDAGSKHIISGAQLMDVGLTLALPELSGEIVHMLRQK